MSMALIDLAKNLENGNIGAKDFTLQFFSLWRQERDNGQMAKDEKPVAECLREVFALADCFTEGPKENDSDLNAAELKQMIRANLSNHGFL